MTLKINRNVFQIEMLHLVIRFHLFSLCKCINIFVERFWLSEKRILEWCYYRHHSRHHITVVWRPILFIFIFSKFSHSLIIISNMFNVYVSLFGFVEIKRLKCFPYQSALFSLFNLLLSCYLVLFLLSQYFCLCKIFSYSSLVCTKGNRQTFPYLFSFTINLVKWSKYKHMDGIYIEHFFYFFYICDWKILFLLKPIIAQTRWRRSFTKFTITHSNYSLVFTQLCLFAYSLPR